MPLLNLRPLHVPLLAFVLSVGIAGCNSEVEPSPSGMPEIRAMQFAGVDLEYALERVAAEAHLPLVLDEIKPKDMSPDLGVYRVDIDLPAGPVDRALRAMKEKVGGFDFEIVDGVIYARSRLALTAKTPLDLPLLPARSFEGSIDDLRILLLNSLPTSFITVEHKSGGPEAVSTKFDIPDKSSVKDAFMQYARGSKLNLIIRRAGFVVENKDYGKGIVGTTVEPRRARGAPSQLPEVVQKVSTIGALASVSARLKVPMVVFDRSLMMTKRGFLNQSMQVDPNEPLVESLDALAESGWGPDQWHFRWKMEDGVPVIAGSRFLYMLDGRDLFRQELIGGEFEGSLPEFARWLNANTKSPIEDVFLGGEIAPDQPRGKLTIAAGTTVEQALVAFAKASNVSIYVTLRDPIDPLTGERLVYKHAWEGAHLQNLAEWLPPFPAGLKVAPY